MRVSFFIDGFNLYHSIAEFNPDFKWLDLYSLCKSYLKPDETILHVFYFTSYNNWEPGKAERHRVYIRALENSGVTVIFGKFKRVRRYCTSCGAHYSTHEEKQTDVNIAMAMLEGAFKNEYDKAVIVSGDSDLLPPIRRIHANFPKIRVGVIAPMGRRAKELKDTADFFIKMERHDLCQSLFPATITIGTSSLTAPESWLPPPAQSQITSQNAAP